MEEYRGNRSKLEGYGELIWEAWEKGWPLRKIIEILQRDKGIKVSLSTLHSFIKVRLKKRKPRKRPEVEIKDKSDNKTIKEKEFDFSGFLGKGEQ